MKKYIIISDSEPEVVENRINELLEQGWQLAGGLSMAYKHEHTEHGHIPGHLVYAQALVKTSNN